MKPHEQLECLLVWIGERPQAYCVTAGELDVLLHMLHVLWAKMADRALSLQEARELEDAPGRGARGLLDDQERSVPVCERGPGVRRVLEYWQRVDKRLGIVARADHW